MNTFAMKMGALALGSLLASSAFAAQTGGLLLKPEQLSAATRAGLLSAVTAEKAKHPERFEAVAAVKGCTTEGYAGKRNPKPQCMTELRDLGREHTLALLSGLVFEAPHTRDGHVPYASAAEQQAYTKAAIEAVGRFRQAETAQVMYAGLMQGNSAFWQSEANALGRLGSDTETHALVDLAGTDNPRQAAAVSGSPGELAGKAPARAAAGGRGRCDGPCGVGVGVAGDGAEQGCDGAGCAHDRGQGCRGGAGNVQRCGCPRAGAAVAVDGRAPRHGDNAAKRRPCRQCRSARTP
jgi:hypothetical protein